MELKLNMKMDNAAFTEGPGHEAARIIREAASNLENGTHKGPLVDINGNKVGSFEVEGWDEQFEEDDEDEDEGEDEEED